MMFFLEMWNYHKPNSHWYRLKHKPTGRFCEYSAAESALTVRILQVQCPKFKFRRVDVVTGRVWDYE